MAKKSRHYEIVHKTPFGEKRLGIVKSTSHKAAVNKLAKQKKLPDNVTSYPVKLTKKSTKVKKSKFSVF